ncbi:MAG: tannase/feruloyl esterase family alpha/beta hydrolase [Gammaproteobacteria bacterium]|nr:tannase/feruloyl esterase family alpha/beta hydrolase [Gammaproteobacteria bacterium]
MIGHRRSSRRPGAGAAFAASAAFAIPFIAAHAQAQPGATCDAAAFARLDLPGTRIVSAAAVTDDERAPPHCQVRAAVNERTGQDGRPYAIGFEMRLPDDWNGRYFHQVNGGNDGAVVPAYGNLQGNQPDNALARGYAVLSSDSGHDGQANPEAGLVGGNLFGFDHQARLDYGYTANVTLTPIAKRIVEGYYGRRPEYSYMVGCSNGGRHALVGATRLAEEFDGFLAGAPGYNLPMVGLQHAWDVQSFEQVAGDVRRAFSRDDMRLVADAVLEQCDALDGAADGIVGALAACQEAFDVRQLSCSAREGGECLGDTQVAALARSFAGPSGSDGRPLYASWWYDAGLASNDWRAWKLESAIPGLDGLPLIATLGAGSLAQVFTTPPTRVDGTAEGLLEYLRAFDFDRDAPKIFATTSRYPLAAMDFMAPADWREPKLAELQAAGGKVIVYHGASDGAFSISATVGWYEQLAANNGGDVSEFARFYPVPGMAHCGGGPATDRFDLFSALVGWVEHGRPPAEVTATARADNPERPSDWRANRSRPLCAWPQVPRYSGSGDVESAASFTCE